MLERHSGVPNDGSCKMQKGSIDISPGWVTRGQHNRQPIAPLVNFRDDNNVLKFIPAMSEPAETLNWILTLTHVNQYRIACDTCDVLREEDETSIIAGLWKLIFWRDSCRPQWHNGTSSGS